MWQPEVVTNYTCRLELSLSFQRPPRARMSKTLSYNVHTTHFCFDVASHFARFLQENLIHHVYFPNLRIHLIAVILVEKPGKTTQRQNKNASRERCRKVFLTYEAAFASWDLVLNDAVIHSLLQLLVVAWESEVLFSTKYRWLYGENTHQNTHRGWAIPRESGKNDATSKQKVSCERCRNAFFTYEASLESSELVLNDVEDYTPLRRLVDEWEPEVLFFSKYRFMEKIRLNNQYYM